MNSCFEIDQQVMNFLHEKELENHKKQFKKIDNEFKAVKVNTELWIWRHSVPDHDTRSQFSGKSTASSHISIARMKEEQKRACYMPETTRKRTLKKKSCPICQTNTSIDQHLMKIHSFNKRTDNYEKAIEPAEAVTSPLAQSKGTDTLSECLGECPQVYCTFILIIMENKSFVVINLFILDQE